MKGWKDVQSEYIKALSKHHSLSYNIRCETARLKGGPIRKYLPPIDRTDPRFIESETKLRSILSQPFVEDNSPQCSQTCPVEGCTFIQWNEQYIFCRPALYESMVEHLNDCHSTTFEQLDETKTCTHTMGRKEYKVMIDGTASHVGAQYDCYESCNECGKVMSHKTDWL